jgi:hypothetical protein
VTARRAKANHQSKAFEGKMAGFCEPLATKSRKTAWLDSAQQPFCGFFADAS